MVDGWSGRLGVFLGLVLLTPSLAFGQVADGRTELLGSVAFATHGGGGAIGGGLQRALGSRVILAVEGAYLTGGRRIELPGVDLDSRTIAADVNLHYLFPEEWTEQLVPYILGGIGYVHTRVRASGTSTASGASDSALGLNLGGGVRWALTDRWTLRPEMRLLFADRSHIRFGAAMLYAFGR